MLAWANECLAPVVLLEVFGNREVGEPPNFSLGVEDQEVVGVLYTEFV